MRPSYPSCRPRSSSPAALSPCGRGWGRGSGSSRISQRNAPAWRSEQGFLLAGLLPLLLLLLATLSGSWMISWRSQARVALQSRLDLCAVQLAVGRERALDRLTRLNTELRMTVHALYVLRSVELVAGPEGIAMGAGAEQALLSMNKMLATAQEGVVAAAAASELSGLRCREDPFSSAPALCSVRPVLPASLQREKTLFPDIRGGLRTTSDTGEKLAQVECRSGRALATGLELRGDPSLSARGFTDVYTE